MKVINQLGTFDVENFGDLLYPVVFRYLLEARDPSLQICQYSPVAGEAPQEAGFATYATQSLFGADLEAPLNVVVGGGDILRSDWNAFAAPYSRIRPGQLGQLSSSLGTLGMLQYSLLKHLPGAVGERFFAKRFRQRRMRHSKTGPFLVDPAKLPAGSVVSYLSCGVPHDFAPALRSDVRRTFDQAQFIYLRDEQSAEKLRRCGVSREIHVAPDLIVTLSDQFGHNAEARKGRKILSRLGVNHGRPFLCFQSKSFSSFRTEQIVELLNQYQRRTGREVVLLPVGHCHDDGPFLRSLARKSRGNFKYADVYSIFDIISVIAASDLFVGTSLHGNITAFSFGIPHVFGPLPVDKAAGFLQAVNLPPELKLRSWGDLSDGIDLAAGLGREFFARRALEAKSRVHCTVDALLESLLRSAPDRTRAQTD